MTGGRNATEKSAMKLGFCTRRNATAKTMKKWQKKVL